MAFFKFFKAAPRPRKIYLRPQGEHYHLEEIFKRVNADYFEGKLDLKITWFQRRRELPQRRIVLGSYHFRTGLIKVNNYLDQAHIPEYFVTYIVYHETLHHLFRPIKGKRGKRSIHHALFKEHEKRFKEYDRAMAFRKEIRKDLFQLH